MNHSGFMQKLQYLKAKPAGCSRDRPEEPDAD